MWGCAASRMEDIVSLRNEILYYLCRHPAKKLAPGRTIHLLELPHVEVLERFWSLAEIGSLFQVLFPGLAQHSAHAPVAQIPCSSVGNILSFL